jgi:hypothetical protein
MDRAIDQASVIPDEIDQDGVTIDAPPKPVGIGGAFKQGFKTTIGEAAQAAGDIAGAQGVRNWGAEVRAENEPVEEESIPVSVARGVGGLVAWLPAIAGTAMALPEVAGAGIGLGLLRGAASMALPAISSKVNTASDLKEKGVDDLTASNASWAAAAATAAMGAVPVGLAGGLLKRVTTGALSGLVTGEAGRMAQNSALSEHPELQQDFTGKQAVVESVIGSVLGGVMGHRSPVKKELDAARTDIEQQLNPQPETPAPILALPHIPEPMIGYPGGDVARAGQMEAYIKSLPEGERVPARARLMGMGSVEARPETTIPLEEILKPAAEPTLNRVELSDIATKLFNGEGAIPAQYFAKATKELGTLEETANRLRAQADALSDVPRNADRKDALNKLADHLDPQEKPTNEQTEIQTQTAEAKPLEAEAKTTALITEVDHAIPAKGVTEVPNSPEAGGNAELEKAASAEGDGTVAKQEEILNPLMRAAGGLKPLDAAAARRAAKVEPVKAEAVLPPREAGRSSPFGENTQERAAARESDMATREQAIRDRFAKGELTHPEATRMLGDLIAEGEEYKAWSSIEHDTSEPQMRERSDGIGDKDAADTQAALKEAKTVGEALTAIHGNVSPKWQKFIDGLMSKPEAMTGKFDLSGISKTNAVTNAARLGEHASGDITLHAGAGVSTLLHEAVHAKTVWGIDNDPVFRKDVQTVFDAAKKSGEFTGNEYMFKDLYEFVAEASTKPELQAALDKIASPKGKTLFGRLIDAIRKLLGLQPGQKSLLQDVLGMVEMAPAPSYRPRTSILDAQYSDLMNKFKSATSNSGEYSPYNKSIQYSERAQSIDFMRGPVSANKAVQTVLSKAMDNISKLKPAFDAQYLKWSQLTHIADMTEKLFDTIKHDEVGNEIVRWGADPKQADVDPKMVAVNPVRDKVDNQLKSAAMAKTFNHATKKTYDEIQSLNDKQRASLYDLIGHYQLAKVFPSLKWEDHVWLTEADKDMYRKAKQLYAQPGVGRMYDEMASQNKVIHEDGMATILKKMGHDYGAPEHLWRAVDVEKGMYIKVGGKEVLNDELKALMNWSITEKSTTKENFDEALKLHEAKKQEAYFSIGRDGDYMVNFHVKDTPAAHAAVQEALKRAGVDKQIVVKPGDMHVFSMFDTSNEMLAVTKQLDILNAAGHLEKPYTAGKTVDKLRELDSSAPNFIRGMLAKIDDDPNLAGADPEMVAQRDAQKELLRRMYINMLPESSVSKFYARRSGTPGYSSDMARSFVKRAAAGAYFVSNHATSAEQNVAMARIRETAKDFGDSGSEFFNLDKQQKAVAVLNELNQRTANNLNPINTPTQDVLGAVGHTFYLSASPSFIIQNLAQPYQITLPYLGGRHGFVASGKALAAAAKDVVPVLKDAIQQGYKDGKWTGVLDATILVDRAKISDVDKRALKALISSGRADWTQGGELSNIQTGQNPRLQNVVRSANLASYYGESLNRMQTALATFRLEMKKNGNNEAAAIERMVSAVDDTQINYASENRSRAIGKHGIFGSVTPLLFAFQQFNLGVMQTLSKLVMQAHGAERGSPERAEAVKSLAGMLATTSVMAGTMGLPLVGAITGAYNALAGDENHPPDAATDYQNFLTDIVGSDGARVIAHGAINYVTGVDAASRLGQENLVPFTQLFSRFADSRMKLKDRLDSGALQFLGPMIGMPVNVAKGFSEMADGDLMKGAIQMAPSAIKGGLKAADLAEKGFTDARGNKWGDATSWDVAVQAFNFTPETKAVRGEAQRGVSAITGALHNQVSELESNFIKAYEAKDAAGRAQALADIAEFRRAHPDMQINIGAALRKRAKDQALMQMTGGVAGRVKQTPFIKEQTRYTQ